MINIKDIPFIIYLCFMALYLTIGNSADNTWSGLFFCFNYFLLFFLFSEHKRKMTRYIGMDLSISLFIFSIVKFFTTFECEKFYTFIPFTIILIGFIITIKWEK